MTAAVPSVTTTPDAFPNGSWSIGPVTVAWDQSSGNEIDVTVSVFGMQVDKLAGTITPGNAQISNSINVLGIVTGTVTLEGDYTAGSTTNGLWIKGQLTGPGFNLPLNYRILSW